MKCQNCNKEIDNDSNFCKYCGTKVVKANVCPNCGSEHLPKDAKFCPDCGCQVASETECAESSFTDKKQESPKDFILSYVLPYWPKQGSELERHKAEALKSAIVKIGVIKRGSISNLYMSKYQFIEQCIKAILDVSKGCTPKYREIEQRSPDYWYFWQELKNGCGESNYNKYWHYNSGTFADNIKEQLLKL